MIETEKEIKERIQREICGPQDPNNMYPPPTRGQEAFIELVRFFMGQEYLDNSCTDPISQDQWNTNALVDVETKYTASLTRVLNAL